MAVLTRPAVAAAARILLARPGNARQLVKSDGQLANDQVH